MISCRGCKHRNCPQYCACCVGWDKYESNTLINPVLAMDIDKEMKMLAKHAMNKIFGVERVERRENTMTIKKVYFNDPVTVVLWEDGTKTIVKAGEDDIYDPEKGLAMAIAKKALGNKGNYYEVFKKWLPKDPVEQIKSELKELFDSVPDQSCPVDTPIASDFDGEPTTLLTAEELAEKLGCTKATIQKQCRQGMHPGAVKVGGKWKIPY